MNKYDGYLMVSDMDGTLLDSESRISEENINAIRKFTEQGGFFTLATGRMLESVRKYLKEIHVNLPVILYNGSKIYDFKNEKILFEAFLNDEIKESIKKVKNAYPSLGIEIYSGEDIYILSSCKYTERLSKKGYEVYYDIPKQLWDNKWTKILIIGEEQELDDLQRVYTSRFGNANLVRSWTCYLEILPDNISKGYALKKLIDLFGIEKTKVIALGDNMNDLEMIQFAEYGFCVNNGHNELIRNARYKCASNDDNAVLSVLKYIDQNMKAANF